MRLLVRVLMVLCLAVAGLAGGPAEAAKKKQKEPSKPKEAWQLPMTVSIVRSHAPGCEPLCPEWIAAEGEITTATPARFRKILKQAGKKKLPVILNSPGGRMDAAIEIGRMIRKAKLDVAVGWTSFSGCKPTDKTCKLPKEQKGIYRGIVYSARGFCNSACPVILAGGVRRLSGVWAYVGVHQVRTTYVQERVTYRERYKIVKGKKKVVSRKEVGRKTVKTTQKDGLDKSLRKKLVAYYKDMGVSTDIIDDMLKAEFKTIYQLSLNRQEELKLVTARDTSDLFTSNRACMFAAAAAPNCVEIPPAAGKVLQKTGPIPIPRQKPNLAENKSGSLSLQQVDSMLPVGAPMRVIRVRFLRAKCGKTCPEWLAAFGVIRPETPDVFLKALKDAGDRKLPIVIDSQGGDLDAAIEIGRAIHERGLDVVVSAIHYAGCVSHEPPCRESNGDVFIGYPTDTSKAKCHGACLAILAAGHQRILSFARSLVAYNPNSLISRTLPNDPGARLEQYFSSIGFPPLLLRRMNRITKGANETMTSFDTRSTSLSTQELPVHMVLSPEECNRSTPPPNCV